jgi:hypothetical protein
MLGYDGRHNTYRPGAGYQNILTYEIKRKSGMNSVAQRVKNGSLVIRNPVRYREYIPGWNGQILREASGAVHPDAFCIYAQMPVAGAAISAVAADYMAFAGNSLSDGQALHAPAQFGYLTHEFMAHVHRNRYGLLGPFIPLVDVDIGAADRGLIDLYEDLVVRYNWFRNLFKPEAFFAVFFNESFHKFSLREERKRIYNRSDRS